MTRDVQTTLFTIGTRPHTVRGVKRDRDGVTSIVLVYTEHGIKRKKVVAPAWTVRETQLAAKAQAKQLHARLVGGAPRETAPLSLVPARVVTVAMVYETHVAFREENWAPSTRRLSQESYRHWCAYAGAATDVATLTAGTLALFRAELRRIGREPSNAVRHAQRVRAMFRSVVEAGLLAGHPIATAKLSFRKEDQERPVPEFQPDETARIVACFDPRKRTQWRPWAVMMLAAILGPRVNALLQQTRENVDLTDAPRTIRWPAETDKTRRERVQALPRAAVLVLRVVAVWLRREGYDGPLLFPSPQHARRGANLSYTYHALWLSLGRACVRAQVPRARRQAMHAFRRYAANQVLRATGGDITAVSYWIGDKDLRVLRKSYLRERAGDGARIARLLSGPHAVPTPELPDSRRPENSLTSTEPTT